jgi:hypothetical protein
MDQQTAASAVATITGTLAAVLLKLIDLWKGRQKMRAEELRTLADGLGRAAAANIRAGMAPLTTTAMNPSAPFMRGPQPGHHQPLQPILSSAQPVALLPAPQPVDYRANKFGTFFL